jgi:hypothetical protein
MWEEFINRIEGMAENLDRQMPDVLAIATMAEVMAMHKERVFDLGLNSDGVQIGEYSTDPAYFSKSAFIRKAAFKQQGKQNKGKFKNGNERKSMFITTGYSGFRQIQGREIDNVKTKYSGDLERSFQVVKVGEAVYYGTTNQGASDKFESLTNQYGEIYPLTTEEKQFMRDDVIKQAIIIDKRTN